MRGPVVAWVGLALLTAQAATPAGSHLAVHGQLKIGKPVSNTVAAGVAQAYKLQALEGQFVHIGFYQPGFPSVIRIASIDGRDTLLERKLPGASGRREPIYWIATRSGKFRLEISSEEPGKPAPFKVELLESRKATPQDEKRVAGLQEFDRSAALNDRHDYKGALETFERALPLFQQAGDRERESAALLNMGLACDKQNQPEQGIGYFERALAVSREIHDQSGEGEALKDIGTDYEGLDQRNRALDLFDQAIAVFRKAKDRLGEVRTLNAYGNAYSRGDYAKAIGYYEQALTIAHQINDHYVEVVLLHNIGGAKMALDLYDEAIRYFETARTLSQERKYKSIEASSLNGLGYAYSNLDRYEDAIRCYEQALPVFREFKDRMNEGVVINNLALAYSSLNDFEKAIGNFEQALTIFREVRNRYWEGQALHNLGWSYDTLNQHGKALPYFGLALAIARELDDKREQGRLLMDMVEGIPELEEALAILREAKDRQAEGWTLRILGETYRKQHQFEKAVQLASEAVAVAHAIREPGSEASSLAVMMSAYKDLNAPRLAIFYGKRAVNLVQSVRTGNQGLSREMQQSLLKANDEMYHTLADLLIGEGRLGEAEQVLGLLKDEEYFNFLRRDADDADVRTRKAGLTTEEEAYNKRFTEIQDNLVAIGAERGNLMAKPSLTASDQQRLSKLDLDIAAGNAAFTKFLDELKAHFDSGPVAARVQLLGESQGFMEDLRELPAGTVAIYTFVAEDQFRAILVTPDVQKSYEYPIQRADLNRKILEFRRILQDPTLDPRPMARELYGILIEKMAGDLKQANVQTLMLSLDGTLRYLPMGALFDGEKYLIEKFALTEFTPVSNARLKDRPDRTWKAAGFGVTRAFDGEPALPAVASELSGIIARKPGEGGVLQGEIRLDRDFTEQAMQTTLQKRFQVVHIASHFSFQPGNETASFLLLGDGTHLSLATLKNMPSLFGGVQLLTLSACNTGMGGGNGSGQEIEGFGRLAQDKGAKAVIASLWSVVDVSTSQLMQEFYHLRESTPGKSKAEALREAQLMLLNGALKGQRGETRGITVDPASGAVPKFPIDPATPYAHPYYWAAFFLMGNWL